MVAFDQGTAVPLLVVGFLSRQALMRCRGRMMSAGKAGKLVLGGGALAMPALILTGTNRALKGALVAAAPAWLTT